MRAKIPFSPDLVLYGVTIIEAWGVANQIEGFFEDAERRAAGLADDDRIAVLARLGRARALLGGVDALQRFRSWRAPDER